MRNAGLDEAQAGIKTSRRNINNLKHVDDTTLMAESEEELKSLLIGEWNRRVKKLAQNSTFKWRSCHLVPSLMANRWGKSGNSDIFYFHGLQNHCGWWLQPWNQKTIASWQVSSDEPRQWVEKQRHYFANRGPYDWSYSFSRSHVQIWEVDHKEGWVPKNWCFQSMVLENSRQSLGQQRDQTSQS